MTQKIAIIFLMLISSISWANVNDDLFQAIVEGKKKKVKSALKKGANVNAKGNSGLTPLHLAVREKKKKIVKLLIKKGANVNAKMTGKYKGMTPLNIALTVRSTKIVKYLIKKGAHVNTTIRDGITPLHIASGTRLHKSAKILIKNSAKVNAKIKKGKYKGMTPLDFATTDKMKKLLLEAGGKSGRR